MENEEEQNKKKPNIQGESIPIFQGKCIVCRNGSNKTPSKIKKPVKFSIIAAKGDKSDAVKGLHRN